MHWRLTLMAAALAAMPVVAKAVSTENFAVHTTGDLVATCDTSASDPMHVASINFCEGFIAGAYQYHQAEAAGPKGRMLFCLPQNGSLTMDQAVRMFVQWAQQNPQYMQERPVDSLVRFATASFPCGK